jgi:hypothetical protein
LLLWYSSPSNFICGYFWGHGITTLISLCEYFLSVPLGQSGFARPIDSVIQNIEISLFLVFDYLLFSHVPDQVSLPIPFGFHFLYLFSSSIY